MHSVEMTVVKSKKPHALKGRKQSPETIAKRIATMKAKRANKEREAPGDFRDVKIFLKKAQREVLRRARAGEDISGNDVYLYVLNAARCAEGGLK